MGPSLAAPNLLGKQILRPQFRPTESETADGTQKPASLKEAPRGLWCAQLESRCSCGSGAHESAAKPRERTPSPSLVQGFLTHPPGIPVWRRNAGEGTVNSVLQSNCLPQGPGLNEALHVLKFKNTLLRNHFFQHICSEILAGCNKNHSPTLGSL